MAINDVITETKESMNWKLAQLIALVAPAVGYILAFTHEVAYCEWFKIPIEFISLNWNVIITGVVASLGGAYLVMLPFIMLSLTKQSKRPMGHVERRVYFLVVIFVVLFAFAYRYLLVRELGYVISYLIGMAALLFLLPLSDTSIRKIKGYRNQLAAYDDPSRKPEDPFLKKWLNLRVIIVFILLVGAFGSAYLDGRAKAMNQEEFLIPSEYPNAVVLRIYGDSMICALVDLPSKVVERTYFVLKVGDSPKSTLTLTRTGCLHIAE